MIASRTLVVVLALQFAFLEAALYNPHNERNNMLSFKSWMNKNNKSYATTAEYNVRYQTFKANLQRIDAMNARNSSATFGLTKFADLSPEEFKAIYLGTKFDPENIPMDIAPSFTAQQVNDIPATFDWRTHTPPVVTPVKNQGQCGSCWAFSTTGNVEGQWALAGHSLVGLSEQNLVDCDHTGGDAGCDGGLMSNAFQYIIANKGIDTESSYPYTAADGTCSFKASNVGATISSYKMIPSDEGQMATYVATQGPVSVAVDAVEWQFYLRGIFDYPCGSSLDHGVLLVGYGSGKNFIDETIDFWTVKNSWGGDWGEQGYIRIERGDNKCGVNKFPATSFV